MTVEQVMRLRAQAGAGPRTPAVRPADNTVIWRYMAVYKFVSLLAERALYFRRADRLADKWEGIAPSGNVRMHAALAKRRPDLMWIIDTHPAGEIEGRESILVNSWMATGAPEDRMWSEYGDNGRGVLVMSSIGRLVTSFPYPGDGRHTAALIPINYIDRASEHYNDLGNSLYAFAYKDRIFAHEQEVRLAIIHGKGAPEGVLADVDLKTLIAAVVPGPQMTPSASEIVRNLVREHGLVLL